MSNAQIIPAPGLDGALKDSVRASSGLSGGLAFDGYTVGQRATASIGAAQKPGTGPISYWARFLVGSRAGVTAYVFAHTVTDANFGSANVAALRIASTGSINFDWHTSSGAVTVASLAGFSAAYTGQVVDVFCTRNGSTIELWINGALVATTTNANAANSLDAEVLKIGAVTAATSAPQDMTVYRMAYFNRALGSADIAAIISRGVAHGDQQASQATLSSGSLVIGNRYRITASGGTFTGVGAANNDVGTEFIATGTTPTWGTGTLVSIGAICAYDFSVGVGFQLQDRFGNRLHAALVGSPVPQWTMPMRQGVLYATGTFSSGVAQRLTPATISGLTADALPAGALIEEVVVNLTSGTPTTVSLGTLSTATTDIVNAQTVAAGRNVETMASRFQATATAQLWATFNAAATATFTIPYTITQ